MIHYYTTSWKLFLINYYNTEGYSQLRIIESVTAIFEKALKQTSCYSQKFFFSQVIYWNTIVNDIHTNMFMKFHCHYRYYFKIKFDAEKHT